MATPYLDAGLNSVISLGVSEGHSFGQMRIRGYIDECAYTEYLDEDGTQQQRCSARLRVMTFDELWEGELNSSQMDAFIQGKILETATRTGKIPDPYWLNGVPLLAANPS